MPASRDPKTPPEKTPSPPSSDKSGAAFDDEEDEWRHDPVMPPKSENPLDSLGRSVSDVVTGSDPAKPAPKKPAS